MEAAQKITVQVPKSLLKRALASTGQGITPTVKQGLTLLAASRAYDKILKSKGKIKFSINYKELREDRR